MIRIFVLPDASGEMLIVGIKRKDKWIKCEMRCEKFYSHKRVARLLRELAQRVEKGVPDGEDRKGQGRQADGDGVNA